MRRRLLGSNLLLISFVLLLLEVPLGMVYGRHEHDALNASLQRDASSLAALSEEVIERPDDHDVGGLAQRFSTAAGGDVIIVDKTGAQLAATGPPSADQAFQAALLAARAGRPGNGERNDLVYATVAVGAGNGPGAVLVARSDEFLDHRVRQFWLVLVAIGMAVLAVSVLVSHLLARWAIGPLSELDETAVELGRGHLDVRAQTGNGPPEVAALALTFNEMADRLDALLKLQRRFVADASHQLRTPLTALRLRIENLEPGDGPAVLRTRDAALVETVRLSRLVDGLLTLARAEGHTPRGEAIDVTPIVSERHEAWLPLAVEQQIDLRLEPADSKPAVALLVPGQLDQILDNLIDNALDATGPGGAVTLSATTADGTIEIHVSDQGPGMTQDERQRAFDPFWRAASATSNSNTGLGLAIVAQLVRANHGTISLDPSPAGGVDAVIRFPPTDQPTQRRPAGDRTAAAARRQGAEIRVVAGGGSRLPQGEVVDVGRPPEGPPA